MTISHTRSPQEYSKIKHSAHVGKEWNQFFCNRRNHNIFYIKNFICFVLYRDWNVVRLPFDQNAHKHWVEMVYRVKKQLFHLYAL